MNAVVIAVAVMLLLSLVRVHVVIALIVATLIGGLLGGLSIEATINAFNTGLGDGAPVALSYALLGAFAVAISKSGIANLLADKLLGAIGSRNGQGQQSLKWLLLGTLMVMALCSQNLLPIHIAFIPLVVPPLLLVFQKLNLDRRAIACVITFGLVTPYMLLPVGFGAIYLNNILLPNVANSGGNIDHINVSYAMALPAVGMVLGVLIAVLFSYRKPRHYEASKIAKAEHTETKPTPKAIAIAAAAVVIAFVVQLLSDSMVLGALIGFVMFSVSGVVRWKEADDLFTDGMKMMASVGFIMIAASGFAAVMRETGEINSLVNSVAATIDGSQALGALLILFVGLVVTMGVGSSFSTVPIVAAIFVPLAVQLGFSDMAIVCLVGTAGALGDAGSPASDSTLGPTAGLNVDGQHSHIWDTVVPTFLHYNIPLLVFGWIAAMVL
ncbi:sodium:proton antiporter [Shewanella avicenniae]|uniref:Sodium:proton antiporter n=1 Tax=Shewanella avicenniae TaxID=2814294 RepID=A0ABX7QRJ1_9GAMM|nr:Na+/H+ antiporter NhaC family protein [Shewanella avicenniae]QSX33493.1 sodium:proton antiporter [Shewanella avicenniae]